MTTRLVLRGDLTSSIDIHRGEWNELEHHRSEWERSHDLVVAVLYIGSLGGESWRGGTTLGEAPYLAAAVDTELSYGEHRDRVVSLDDVALGRRQRGRWVVLRWLNTVSKEKRLAVVDLRATLWLAAESMERAARALIDLEGLEEATWRLAIASELAAAMQTWDEGAPVRDELRRLDAGGRARERLVEAHRVAAAEQLRQYGAVEVQ